MWDIITRELWAGEEFALAIAIIRVSAFFKYIVTSLTLPEPIADLLYRCGLPHFFTVYPLAMTKIAIENGHL